MSIKRSNHVRKVGLKKDVEESCDKKEESSLFNLTLQHFCAPVGRGGGRMRHTTIISKPRMLLLLLLFIPSLLLPTLERVTSVETYDVATMTRHLRIHELISQQRLSRSSLQMTPSHLSTTSNDMINKIMFGDGDGVKLPLSHAAKNTDGFLTQAADVRFTSSQKLRARAQVGGGSSRLTAHAGCKKCLQQTMDETQSSTSITKKCGTAAGRCDLCQMISYRKFWTSDKKVPLWGAGGAELERDKINTYECYPFPVNSADTSMKEQLTQMNTVCALIKGAVTSQVTARMGYLYDAFGPTFGASAAVCNELLCCGSGGANKR